MSLEPTFFGYVATSNDALLIFEACRGNGLLQKVSRRPHDRERDRLIKSGNIFVFDEQSSGIRRWTDGIAWSPSRILGNYLIYRQLERPLQPGEKKRAQKHRLSNGHQRAGSDNPELDSPDRLKNNLSPARSPSPREAGGPIRTHSKKIKSDSSSNASDNGSIINKPRKWSEEQEKELAGSLTDSYGFKDGGLIKKTMSVEYEGTVHHLVSYYTIDDVMLSRLPSPSQDQRLADLAIGGDLMTRTNFRVHPSSEAGNTVSRNSPTQQRTQSLLQHQRRNDDPRHGPGYGAMYNNAPPPMHGQGPPEGYPDPNNHYAYGPGPQPPYQGRYYAQQPQYQVPVFMHGAPPPPHMGNVPYYGPPPQGPPPQYAPGPPQHPQHQQVDVKREGPPNQYYSAYSPYPPASSNPAPMYSGHYPQRGPPPPQQPPPQQPQQPPQMVNQHPYQAGPPDNRGAPPPAQPPRYDGPPPPQPQNPGNINNGNSPRHAPAGGPPPPQQNIPPPQNVPPQAQPLSRHNSSESPTPAGPPPPTDSQSTFGWTWSQSQPSQAPTQQTRA
jgi:hypothetical protein